MKHKLLTTLRLTALFLALASSALASTTWYVNGVTGSNSNDCTSSTTACKTIKHAISLALSGDSIMVAAATYTENLTIGINLKVIGSGATTTIIDGGGAGRVVTISNANARVALSRMTIRNGYAAAGGGIGNPGTLTLSKSTVSGNITTLAGGGISNRGTLTINNSTVSGNVAYYSICKPFCVLRTGGGISNRGTLTINNSTISGNFAGYGGGISGGGKLTINNTTVSENSGLLGTGGIAGGGTLQNSIVANNSGGNCSGTMASNGYNLSSDNTCNFNNTGDLNNTDPLLGPLQNNGGPTQTQALLSGSPAIDAGNPSGCTDGLGHMLTTDQRGMPRPDPEDTGGCDMGAYERQSD